MKKNLFFPCCDKTEIYSDEEYVFISQDDIASGEVSVIAIPIQLISEFTKRLSDEAEAVCLTKSETQAGE